MNLKSFGKNTIWYFAGSVCIRLAGFALIPLYTRSLSMAEYGVLCTLLVTIQMMTLLMGMATDKGFLRFASECEARNSLGMLLGSTLVLNCAGALLVSAMSVSVLLPIFSRILRSPHVFSYVALACLVAVFQALFDRTVVYYRAKHLGFKFLVVNMPVLLMLLAMNILFLQVLKQGVQGALLAQVLSYGCVWLVAFVMVTGKTGFGFSSDLMGRLMRFSLPLLVALAAALSLDLSAVYILGYFSGHEKVALYSLGYKIAQMCVMAVILPFQLAYEPFVYGNIDHPEIKTMISKFLTYLMLTYTIAAVTVAFLARLLLSVMAPPEYHQAYRVTLLLLLPMGFIGVYYVAESLLGIGQRTGFVAAVIVFCTLLALPLYYILIPAWGIYGAVAVFNIVWMLMGVVLMVAGHRVFPVRLEARRLGMIGIVFVSLLVVVFVLFRTEPYLYYTLIPMAIGMAFFLLYAGRFADEVERSFIKGLVQTIRLRMMGRPVEMD